MKSFPRALFLFICLSFFSSAPAEAAPIVAGSFSTTWDTSQDGVDGSSPSNQIGFKLGSGADGESCSGTLYWEEIGNDTNNGSSTLDANCNDELITFPAEGNYRIDISGTFPTFQSQNDIHKIRSVEQWGNNSWRTFWYSFSNTINLVITASDVPNLSLVTSMVGMFQRATNFNSPLNSWDVSSVTDIRNMFSRATAFNQPLNNWDVSSVIEFGDSGEETGMFAGATSFNRDISMWNVSGATNFEKMFSGATSFNQDLSNWDVSGALRMSQMFDNSGLSKENYSAILNSWSELTLQPAVTFGAATIAYLDTATAARESIIDNYTWRITDGGLFTEPSDARFITRWDTTLAAPTNEIKFDIQGSDANFYIDWGDGNVDYYSSAPGEIQYTYSAPGIKTVTFIGAVPQFYFCYEDTEADKIIDVVQWGANVWQSFDSTFAICTHLTDFSATDAPNLSQVTDMSYMFNDATAFNERLDTWDISNIEYMNDMLVGSAFTEAKYTRLLNSWSELTVQPDVNFATDAQYCGATAQAARDVLTGAPNNWVITDGGATTDCVIEADEEESEGSNGSSGTRVGERSKSFFYSSTTTSTPMTVTKESFIQSVRNLIDYLTKNEAMLDTLTSEERTKLIVGLRNIIVFLLTLIPGV